MNDFLELLSRHLDGDLSPAEAEELQARLARDPELAARLAALGEVRDGLAALAVGEEPPAVLDELVEPLRREPPRTSAVRPALRWLAAAAAVVLGVSVGVQVHRQQPRPQVGESPPPVVTPRAPGEYFQLRPLPAEEGSGDEPIGAADRLLREALPEPTAEALEPVPPMGPLADAGAPPPTGPPPGEPVADAAGAAPAPPVERAAARDVADRATVSAPQASASLGGEARSEPTTEAPPTASRKAEHELAEEIVVVLPDDRLEVEAPEGTDLAELSDHDLPPGRYPVLVRVDAEGRIVDATPRQASPPPPSYVRAARAVVGLVLHATPPGEHRGVVVVTTGRGPG